VSPFAVRADAIAWHVKVIKLRVCASAHVFFVRQVRGTAFLAGFPLDPQKLEETPCVPLYLPYQS
jgi:hypothetical protein